MNKLHGLCQNIMSFAITVNFWTEQLSNVSFALHFYEESNSLISLIICCRLSDLEDDTDRFFVDEILLEFNLKLTAKRYAITDNESKMKCSFKMQ